VARDLLQDLERDMWQTSGTFDAAVASYRLLDVACRGHIGWRIQMKNQKNDGKIAHHTDVRALG
jgi:hypothetical protein